MPRAISPGPAGLKFWRAPGLSADNTADSNNLPAGIADSFYPWGRKRPVQDWVWGNLCLYPPSVATTFSAAAGSYALTGSDAALTTSAVDSTNLPAGGANWFNPWGRKRPVQDWVKGSIPAVPVTFTAASGSYALTGGSAVTFAFGQVAGSGSYSITGSAAALALRQVAGAGSYSLTGAAASTVVAVNFAAAAGSYTSTGGSAVTFAFGQSAAAGSYTLTGAAAAFIIPGGMVAAAGSYTLTGSDAALTVSGGVVDYLPAGMTGGYVPWSRPFPVNLRTITGRPLAAAPEPEPSAGDMPAGMTGGYVPWGRPFPVNLRTLTGRPLAEAEPTPEPEAGDMPAGATNWFNPWGRYFPINLRTSTVRVLVEGPIALTAAAGSYTITGASAALALRLTANSGAYTVSGTAAVLARGFAAGAGAYAILGTDANLVQAGTITLTCGAGSYTLTGGSDVAFLGVTPPTVEQPGGSYTGGRVEYRKYRLRKKRLLDECEELLEYLQGLPPAQAREVCQTLPLERLSLLELLPLPPPHGIVIPQGPRRPHPRIEDDEDEDEIALLLQLLS